MTDPCWWTRNLPNWYSIGSSSTTADTYCKEHDILQSVLSSIEFIYVGSFEPWSVEETGATLSPPSRGDKFCQHTENNTRSQQN